MQEMAGVSWISLCVLVAGAAIALAKPGGFLETHNVTDVELEEENTKIQTNESVDDVRENMSILGVRSQLQKSNSTHPHLVTSHGEFWSAINGSYNVTRHLHVGMKTIYHHYKHGTASVHSSNLISSVSAYMGPFIPSLAQSNTTFHRSRKTHAKKSHQSRYENVNQTSNYGYSALNTSGYQDQAKQHMLKMGLIKGKIETEDGVTLVDTITTTTASNVKVSSTVAEQGRAEDYMKCQHVPGLNKPRWLRMIVLCPANWREDDTKLRCQFWQDLNTATIMDDLTFLPVQDENGTVYANIYCAKCHKVVFLLPWISRFECNRTSQQAFQASDFTDLDFLFTNILTSTCQREIIPSIPHTVEECQGEIQPYLSTRKGDTHDTDVLSASYPVSFTVIMNFDFTGNTHILFTANQKIIEEEYTTKCQVGETFDPYTNSCRQLTCNSDYTLVGNECMRTSGASSSPDEITDLSQLRTVDIVTLQLNITFGDFLIMRYQDIEPDIVAQIAGSLNISVDRLKDVNISYELGSIKGSVLQVTPLTEEEYHSMLQQHLPNNETLNGDPDIDLRSTAQQMGKNLNRRTGKPAKTSPKSTNKKERFKNRNNTAVHGDKSEEKPTTPKMTSRHPDKYYNRTHSNVTSQHEQDFDDTQGRIKQNQHISKYNLDIVRSLLANVSRHNSGVSKQLLHHPFKFKAKQVSTKYSNFFRYHFKYPDNDTDLYVSAPVNQQGQRVSLIIPDNQSLQLLLDHNLVMRISFVLVPPNDPQSNEAKSRDLLRKMDSLIYEQQFSLKLNGNDLDVVAVNGLTEDSQEIPFCPLGVEYLVYDDEFMMIQMDNSTVMYVNKTNSYVGVGMFDLFVVVSGSDEAGQTNFTDLTQYAFVCFMPRISERDCDMIDLTMNEYHIAGDNKSIIFEDKQYDIFQYRFVDEKAGSVQICVPSTFNTRNMTLRSYVTTIDHSCSGDFDAVLKAEGYMTLVLGRVSIAALACVLFTYSLFRGLRNLPGLNLMNLTFALLVTQIIFAGGIEENESYLCKAVAVSLHYTLLAAHFWMNLISYDVYKTFTNPVILTRARETRKYFYRYAIYGWGVPCIIVCICMFIDFSHLLSGVSIGYGAALASASEFSLHEDNVTTHAETAVVSTNDTSVTNEQTIHTCWITQPLAALVAFGAIILLIFVVNCILFGRTIACISKTAKIAKKRVGMRHSNSSVHKMSDTSEVMLYVRMSTVMGFTWIFGLSSSIFSSFVTLPTYIACTVIHAVSILFIILNTSQGFFIFVVFVCNRRVLGLYTDLFHKVKLLVGQRNSASLFSVSSTLSSSHNTRQSR